MGWGEVGRGSGGLSASAWRPGLLVSAGPADLAAIPASGPRRPSGREVDVGGLVSQSKLRSLRAGSGRAKTEFCPEPCPHSLRAYVVAPRSPRRLAPLERGGWNGTSLRCRASLPFHPPLESEMGRLARLAVVIGGGSPRSSVDSDPLGRRHHRHHLMTRPNGGEFINGPFSIKCEHDQR